MQGQIEFWAIDKRMRGIKCIVLSGYKRKDKKKEMLKGRWGEKT